jgi:cobalt transporter subunit CbtB
MQGYSTTGNTTPVPAAAASRRNAVLPALAAAFLGLLVVWGVGFSHIEALHNAAHDTRHSNAFPCH